MQEAIDPIYKQLQNIANGDIKEFKNTPIYLKLEQRKTIARYIHYHPECITEKEYFNMLNNDIISYFSLYNI
jgi:hypothetical protein